MPARRNAIRVRRCFLAPPLVFGVTPPAQHQIGREDAPVFRTSTEIVTIDAAFTDAGGKPVTDLTRDDFEVTVAGKRQTLEFEIRH